MSLDFKSAQFESDFVSVHKHAKKKLGQYPAILTSRLVNNPYILPARVANHIAGFGSILPAHGASHIINVIIVHFEPTPKTSVTNNRKST